MDEFERALTEFAINSRWLALQFLFGGDAGYRRASAFMEQNRRITAARQNNENASRS